MRIEIDDENRTIVFDGVRFTFDVLLSITRPDPAKCYRFKRTGGDVTVYACTPADLAPAEVRPRGGQGPE
jgi:hypothetical protein